MLKRHNLRMVQAVVAMVLTTQLSIAASPRVTAPPASFFAIVASRDRDAAEKFYRKYIDVKGMPVVASREVSDRALQRTYEIVTHLLAGRPDVIA